MLEVNSRLSIPNVEHNNFITKMSYWVCLSYVFFLPWGRLGNVGGATLSKLAGAAVALLWMLGAIKNGVRRLEPIHGLAFAFFLLNLGSLFWSVDRAASIERSISYLSVCIMLIAFWDLFRDETSIRRVFQALVWGGFVPTLAVIKNYLAGIQVQWGRYATGADNENTTAYTLAITLPFAVLLATSSSYASRRMPAATSSQTRFSQVVGTLIWLSNLVYLPLCFFAIALTGTRFAIVMLFPIFAYWMRSFLSKRPLTTIATAVLASIGVVGLAQFLPGEITTRLASTGTEISSGDLNGRLTMWKIAAETFADNPILGTGSATSNAASIPYLGYAFSTHNSFLAILVELGVVGLLITAAIVWCAVRYAWKMQNNMGSFWVMLMAVWLLGNLPLTNFHKQPTWLIFGLVTCAYFASSTVDESRNQSTSPSLREVDWHGATS